MSRPWVKLHTDILDHFELDAVSPLAFKVYVKALALAGKVDDDGRLGTRDKVAYRLRLSEDELDAALEALDGRIVEADGQLHMRDWSDYQSPKRKPEPREQVAARVRKHRATHTNAPGSDDVTQPLPAPSRNGNAPLETEIEIEPEEETLHADADASAKRARKWDPLAHDFVGWIGKRTCKDSRAKGEYKPRAFVWQLVDVFGEAADDDQDRARELAAAWHGSLVAENRWHFVTPRTAVAMAEKWVIAQATRSPPRRVVTPASPEKIAQAKAEFEQMQRRRR